MAGEVTVPLLPCADVDETGEFYRMLGFEQTYRQLRPNPYVVVQREDIGLHFFGMPGYDPAHSYSTCLVTVPDIGALFESFAASMRAAHGKLLVAGIPRITRPRRRKNADNLTGFSIVDPGGNWIRFMPQTVVGPRESTEPPTKLRKTLDDAVVIGDSHGDAAQAAKILDGSLARVPDPATVDLVDALAYRAELAVRLNDNDDAARLLDRISSIELTETDRAALADSLINVEELQRIVSSPMTD